MNPEARRKERAQQNQDREWTSLRAEAATIIELFGQTPTLGWTFDRGDTIAMACLDHERVVVARGADALTALRELCGALRAHLAGRGAKC